MARRLLVLIGALTLVCVFGALSPTAVNAACVPDVSAGDDSIICDATTINGGSNVLALLNGTGDITANGDFSVLSGLGSNTINVGLMLIGEGNIDLNGNIRVRAGNIAVALLLLGEGNINSTGNVWVRANMLALAQLLVGEGNINQTGDVRVIGGLAGLGQILIGKEISTRTARFMLAPIFWRWHNYWLAKATLTRPAMYASQARMGLRWDKFCLA